MRDTENPYSRICKLSSCGKQFAPTTPQQFYCTTTCRDLKYTAKKGWKVERVCKLPACGQVFVPNQYRQTFCTKECQKKSIAANFKERECGVQHCKNIFKPKHRYHIYCSEKCLQYARNPFNTAATLARQKLRRKGVYVVRETDEQFRQKLIATNPLRCTQAACMPDCRIRGVERLGCVI